MEKLDGEVKKTMKQRKKISNVTLVCYIRLILRFCLLIMALFYYIADKTKGNELIFGGTEGHNRLLPVLAVLFGAEMVFRFFPSAYESKGCQKQFRGNYVSRNVRNIDTVRKQSGKGTGVVILSWTALNLLVALLYFTRVLDWGFLLLISIFYSVCDIICILFFCPFQAWMMKNKCCGTCRIYNWDYAMMFTPFILIHNQFAYALVFLAVALLVRWEIAFFRHPEWFSEQTNERLSCAGCTEKLCIHKRQLKSVLPKGKAGGPSVGEIHPQLEHPQQTGDGLRNAR